MKLKTIFLFMILLLVSCQSEVTQHSSSGATQVDLTKFYNIPINANGFTVEQQQIKDRYDVTNDPTKIMWVHIIAPMTGKLITRISVRNKISSSGKRLEPVHAVDGTGSYPNSPVKYTDSDGETTNSYFETDEFIQPDGTYGSSDAYQYWFDTYGRYHQLGTAGGLGYLLTDYPIDLNNPQDEVTGLYNAQKAAYDWQKIEEEKLKKELKVKSKKK
jgi:hypothetical protein